MQKFKFILLLVGLVVVSGCYTSKKANKQVYRAHDEYEIVLARACSVFYPTRATETTRDTQFAQGRPIITRDTIVETIDGVKINTVYQKTFIHDTVRFFTTIKTIDSAKMRTMYLEADSALKLSAKDRDALIKAQNRLSSSEKQKWITWGILILLILGFAAFKYFKLKP